MSTYVYSITNDFGGDVPYYATLHSSVVDDVTITTGFEGIHNSGDDVTFYFQGALSAPEIAALDAIVSSHDNTVPAITTVDMEGKRLVNVGGPIDSTDAMTYSTFSSVFSPIVTSSSFTIPTSETTDITIEGYNFSAGTTVTITSQTVNSVTFVNPTVLIVNVTTTASAGSYDLTVTNEAGMAVVTNGIITIVVVWIDLRSGGETLSTGSDVRMKTGMSVQRDVNGMYFTGSSPWSSWVKFERNDFQWARGDNRSLDWIFTRPTSAMMIGIGSSQTSETSTSQYTQAETLVYFSNSTSMWGFYGNSGTPGSSASQSAGFSIAGGTGVFKAQWTNDGSAGCTFTLYEIPSVLPTSWNDISTILYTTTISTVTPSQSPIFPFIIPLNGGSMRFVAFKIQ